MKQIGKKYETFIFPCVSLENIKNDTDKNHIRRKQFKKPMFWCIKKAPRRNGAAGNQTTD